MTIGIYVQACSREVENVSQRMHNIMMLRHDCFENMSHKENSCSEMVECICGTGPGCQGG